MKIKQLMLFLVGTLLSLMVSCVPIDPNWSPEQKAQVQNANANMVLSGGIAALGAAADIYALKSPSYGYGGYWYGGRHYYHRGLRHGRYYYY